LEGRIGLEGGLALLTNKLAEIVGLCVLGTLVLGKPILGPTGLEGVTG